MRSRLRPSLVASLFCVAALYGCAATPREQPQAALGEVPPPTAEVVAPAPPPGLPIDVYTEKAIEPRSVWTAVRSNAQLDLATGTQSVTIELQGRVTIDEPLVIDERSGHWRVIEAIDQDGRALLPSNSPDNDDRNVTPAEFTNAYLAKIRGDAPRWLRIQAQLTNLTQRPRVLQKLTVVAKVPVIRRVEERMFEISSVGQIIEVAEGVTAVLEEIEPSSGSSPPQLQATVRADLLGASHGAAPIVGAGVIDAAGVAVNAVNVQHSRQAGSMTFVIDGQQRLVAPLRLRLIVATDVGQEQITCVARDIPVP